jgi:plastocyanin
MHRVRQSSILVTITVLVLGLLLAACGGDDDSGGNAKGGETISATNGKVTVDAHDVYFNAKEIDATPGDLTITLKNEGAQQHSFVIDDPKFKVQTPPGSSKTGTVDVKAGSYAYYCDIPGHRATMNGTLVVK